MLGENPPLIPARATVFWYFLCTSSCARSTTYKVATDLNNPSEKVKSPFGR